MSMKNSNNAIGHRTRAVTACSTSRLKGHKTGNMKMDINPLTPELNPSAQRCLTIFFTGVLLL
jgi:hypothetical protein